MEKILIPEDTNFIAIFDYTCYIKAIEAKTPHKNKSWIYVIQYIELTEKDDNSPKKIIEIPSQHYYKTYQDAIQDAYGIVELLGFRFRDKSDPAKIMVLDLDKTTDEYIVRYVLFDGFDFFTPIDEEETPHAFQP
jgi:hypothetical protein